MRKFALSFTAIFGLVAGLFFALSYPSFAWAYSDSDVQVDVDSSASSRLADGWYVSGSDGLWHFASNGSDVSGWLFYNSNWYYLDPSDGAMQTGFVNIASVQYHLSSSGAMDKGWVLVDGSWYYATDSGALVSGWARIAGNRYYFLSSYAMATGVHRIDGQTYHFGEYGVSQGWSLDSGSWYWCEDGLAQTGWLSLGSSWYYLDPDNAGMMVTGKQLIGAASYCFNSDGLMAVGWINSDGVWYYASRSGSLVTGWIFSNSRWYYLDPASFEMETGLLELDGAAYYLNSDGSMAVGWILDGGWRYASSNGTLSKGWLLLNGVWYYVLPDTYLMVTGECKIAGVDYLFASNGAMAASEWVECSDGLLRFATSSGAIDAGMYIKDGVVYRLDESGIAEKASGFIQVSGLTLYVDEDGSLHKGWLSDDGAWYFFDNQGIMKSGWLLDSGSWYYLNSDGSMAIGWKLVSGSWYYLNSNGSMATGWLHQGSKWYWLDSSGVMATGMRVIDGVRRIFWSDGSCDKVGWQNPSQYPQVSSWTVKLPDYCTGYFTYVTPSRISVDATRDDCIDAFIQRAYEYIGTQYIEPWSTAPGGAVDCSGFVLQCLYATGMDLGVYNPYNHRWDPSQTYNSMNWYNSNLFMPVSTSSIQRGDVLYYRGHIAIALGGGMMIDSWPGQGVNIHPINARGSLIGAARPFV